MMTPNSTYWRSDMPGNAPPLADERQLLLAYLQQQRDGLRNSAFGLTTEQARIPSTAGTLTIGGLIKHSAAVERSWSDNITQDHRPLPDYEDQFILGAGETIEGTIADYLEACEDTDAVIAATPLDQPVPVPRNAPWFPKDVDAWNVRWVVLHLIEETARHAGHADIVRESIDGATMLPLMAAVEAWPETDWLKPWKPAS
jgi:hypothetical protein